MESATSVTIQVRSCQRIIQNFSLSSSALISGSGDFSETARMQALLASRVYLQQSEYLEGIPSWYPCLCDVSLRTRSLHSQIQGT